MGYNDRADQATKQPAALGPARATHVRYLVLAAGCSLAVLTYIQRQGFVAGTPYIKKDLGLDDEQVGYLASVWLLAYGLFQVPGGLLGDWLGGRHLLTLLVLGWSLLLGAAALTVLFPAGVWLAFAYLLLLRFLFGLFQGGGFPALARVLADWMPTQERGRAQGMVWTFSRLGGFGAPLLFLWLLMALGGAATSSSEQQALQAAQAWSLAAQPGLSLTPGPAPYLLGAAEVVRQAGSAIRPYAWAAPFWLLAGLGLLWCAVFWPWFRNRPAEMKRVNAAEREWIESNRPTAVGRTGPVPWSSFLRSRSVWGLCLLYGFGGFAGNFFTSWLPIYVRDHRHMTDQATAWLAALPLGAGMVSCVLGGVLSDWLVRRTGSPRWGRRLIGCVGFAVAALLFLSTIWVQEVWLLALLFSLIFFCNDANMGPAWASCADVGERYAGTLSGAMNMTGAFLGAAGMWIAGALFKRNLDNLVFVLFACSYAMAALCWLAVDVTKPLVPKDRTDICEGPRGTE
jgi:sugar phosphate permease